MKFGLWFGNTGRYVDPSNAVALAQAAEAAGFESLWTVEHTIVPAGYASAYPYDESGTRPSAGRRTSLVGLKLSSAARTQRMAYCGGELFWRKPKEACDARRTTRWGPCS